MLNLFPQKLSWFVYLLLVVKYFTVRLMCVCKRYVLVCVQEKTDKVVNKGGHSREGGGDERSKTTNRGTERRSEEM